MVLSLSMCLGRHMLKEHLQTNLSSVSVKITHTRIGTCKECPQEMSVTSAGAEVYWNHNCGAHVERLI